MLFHKYQKNIFIKMKTHVLLTLIVTSFLSDLCLATDIDYTSCSHKYLTDDVSSKVLSPYFLLSVF